MRQITMHVSRDILLSTANKIVFHLLLLDDAGNYSHYCPAQVVLLPIDSTPAHFLFMQTLYNITDHMSQRNSTSSVFWNPFHTQEEENFYRGSQ